jgi:hypothetical protein
MTTKLKPLPRKKPSKWRYELSAAKAQSRAAMSRLRVAEWKVEDREQRPITLFRVSLESVPVPHA